MAEPQIFKPFVKTLEGGETHLPLLTEGVARRMRAGMVTLGRGSSCGRHGTEDYEELLVILEGRGEAELEGHGARLIELSHRHGCFHAAHHHGRWRGLSG